VNMRICVFLSTYTTKFKLECLIYYIISEIAHAISFNSIQKNWGSLFIVSLSLNALNFHFKLDLYSFLQT
jgi:hypothetical protein